MSDRLPERMSDRMPERMPERMSDRMPERISDRMPRWGSLEVKYVFQSFKFTILDAFGGVAFG